MSDTTQIILAVIGTGVTLLGILVGLLVSLFRILRQDIKEIDTRRDAYERPTERPQRRPLSGPLQPQRPCRLRFAPCPESLPDKNLYQAISKV